MSAEVDRRALAELERGRGWIAASMIRELEPRPLELEQHQGDELGDALERYCRRRRSAGELVGRAIGWLAVAAVVGALLSMGWCR